MFRCSESVPGVRRRGDRRRRGRPAGAARPAAGPPVLLLHGHPRTSRDLAPGRAAARRGRATPSSAPTCAATAAPSEPPARADHAPLLANGPWRGDLRRADARASGTTGSRWPAMTAAATSRCGWRWTTRTRCARLAVLDGVPIVEHLERCDARFAAAWWHWFFFAQPDKPAERVILADPDAWYRGDPRARWATRTYAEYRAAIHDPATVRAMLEDYRAGLGMDRADEEADRAAGRRVALPDAACCWSRARRPGGAPRRPAARSGRTGPTTCAATTIDSRPPHGRGGSRRAGRGARRVLHRGTPRTDRGLTDPGPTDACTPSARATHERFPDLTRSCGNRPHSPVSAVVGRAECRRTAV